MTIDRHFGFDVEFSAECAVRYALLRAIDKGDETVTVKVDDLRAALDQPAQEPVAWMYHYPGELEYGWQRYEFKRRIQSYEGMSCNEEDAGMIETPLYAAPQPATLPDDLSVAISQLRALCNDKIRKINQGRGVRTEGFRDINDLLKACDKVFATLPDESR